MADGRMVCDACTMDFDAQTLTYVCRCCGQRISEARMTAAFRDYDVVEGTARIVTEPSWFTTKDQHE